MLLFKFLFYARFVARVMCCIITRTLFEYRAPGGRARPWGPRLLSGPWDFVLSVGLRTRDPGASSQRPPLVGLGPQPGSWLRAGSGVQQGRVGFPVPRPVTSAGRLSAGSGQPSSRPSARASLTRCARLPPVPELPAGRPREVGTGRPQGGDLALQRVLADPVERRVADSLGDTGGRARPRGCAVGPQRPSRVHTHRVHPLWRRLLH